ncbi:cyclic pyranopterin monophosphate synthase MoaC/MOSC-domain-containing protein [Caldicellulosiruptoraceae bacterium PP1]
MEFTHVDKNGHTKMVDVSHKEDTLRYAKAYGRIYLPRQVIEMIIENKIKKGDVLTVAKIAAIMASKKTSDLIPLCHNINLSYSDIEYTIDLENNFIEAISIVKTKSPTGVEMEAINSIMIFLETIYDMCKGVTRDIIISDIQLIEKYGGKSGYFLNEKFGIVLSINISKEKGTPKQSIEMANVIENFGIEGDAHAGSSHRQVSMLDQSSIDKMKEYNIPGLCFGKFAENITTKNVDFSKLKIGSTLKIGSDVILEISQIGKKCHGSGCEIARTVGVCIMPTEGLFAKVIKGGQIKMGDIIRIK